MESLGLLNIKLARASLAKTYTAILLLALPIVATSACDGAPQVDLSAARLDQPNYFSKPLADSCCLVIANAGGGVDGNANTNSVEAIEANYALGTRLFEVDFARTSDGYWVGAQDWRSWKKLREIVGQPMPDLASFKAAPLKIEERGGWSIVNTYTPLDLGWLQDFLLAHPDANIVTDVRQLKTLPDLVDKVFAHESADQFIFQAYSLADVDRLDQQQPTTRIILTLYRMDRGDDLTEHIASRKNRLEAISLPMNWAYDDKLLRSLKTIGLPLYLHGAAVNINSRGLHHYFAQRGVNGFYLD